MTVQNLVSMHVSNPCQWASGSQTCAVMLSTVPLLMQLCMQVLPSYRHANFLIPRDQRHCDAQSTCAEIQTCHTETHVASTAVQDGPHFADWGEMQQQGAVSMASAPIHISTDVVAVLTLASSQQAAFEE